MNARRARERRQAERATTQAILDASLAATPRYVRTLPNGSECWMRGRIMFVIPPLVDDYPDPIKAAIDRRRRASLSGQCDCGAVAAINRRGSVEMNHEDVCDATDRALDELAAAHGMKFERWVA